MTTPAAVADRILALMRGPLNLAVTDARTDLLATGLLDSLMLVDLLVLLEREFGVVVRVEELELDQLRSVERLAEVVVGLGPRG